jgi:hypothetical protein
VRIEAGSATRVHPCNPLLWIAGIKYAVECHGVDTLLLLLLCHQVLRLQLPLVLLCQQGLRLQLPPLLLCQQGLRLQLPQLLLMLLLLLLLRQ